MRTLLMFLTWGVAFAVGVGWISWPWLALCFLFGYARGIMFTSSRYGVDDFRQMDSDTFRVAQRVVFFSTAMTVLPIVIWGGIGLFVRWLMN